MKIEKKQKICLTGAWVSSDNIGDHAMLSGVMDFFSKKEPNDFSVITASPKNVRKKYSIKAYAPKKTPLRLIMKLIFSDCFVFTGGTPFFDNKVHMTYYYLLSLIAKLSKSKIIILGVSLRKIKSPYCYFLLKKILQYSDFIGPREMKSYIKFKTFLKSKKQREKLHLIPDMSFAMEPISPVKAQKMFENEIGESNNKVLGICLRDFRADKRFQSQHYSRNYTHEGLSNYHKSIFGIAEYAIEKYNFKIVFLPMNTCFPDDDRVLANEIKKSLAKRGFDNNVHIVKKQYNAREMKGFMGNLDFVIGVRFHSTVLAASMGVPALGLSYALKNTAFFEYLGLDDYVIDITRVNVQLGMDLLDKMISNEEKIISHLNNKNSIIKSELSNLQAVIDSIF